MIRMKAAFKCNKNGIRTGIDMGIRLNNTIGASDQKHLREARMGCCSTPLL